MCFFLQFFFIAQPLAGGYYQSYLYNQCPGSTILTVESNPTAVAAARDFFGFEGVVDPHAALAFRPFHCPIPSHPDIQ